MEPEEFITKFIDEVSESLTMRNIGQHVIVAETEPGGGYHAAMTTTNPYRLLMHLSKFVEEKVRMFTDDEYLTTQFPPGRVLVLAHMLRLELEQMNQKVGDDYLELGKREEQVVFDSEFYEEEGFKE